LPLGLLGFQVAEAKAEGWEWEKGGGFVWILIEESVSELQENEQYCWNWPALRDRFAVLSIPPDPWRCAG